MSAEPFFTLIGDTFTPGAASTGPWSTTSLHARVVIGLLAREIERLHGGEDFMPTRLTTDLYRLPDLSPAKLTTRAVREGSRIKVIDAEFLSGGRSVARATCQLLRRTANPQGRVWSPPVWDAPPPSQIPAPARGHGDMGGMWATRPIVGAFGSLGRRQLWMSAGARTGLCGSRLSAFVSRRSGGRFRLRQSRRRERPRPGSTATPPLLSAPPAADAVDRRAIVVNHQCHGRCRPPSSAGCTTSWARS